MKSKHNWQYDEIIHSGVDYSDPAQVEVYDKRHQQFRDYQKGADGIVDALGISQEHTLIDMGAGTGAFSLHAAKYCKLIYAVDVSTAMLDYAKQKAEKSGIESIIFCHGGFLTYEHDAEAVDAMVCTGVLHHLPDFWKLVGLRRAIKMLKPGGKFYLFDVVFPAAMTDHESQFDNWVQSTADAVGPDFASEVKTTIRDEFVTCDWILEGLLRQAGFGIDNVKYGDRFGANYICTRS